jgi:hypothetical protein
VDSRPVWTRRLTNFFQVILADITTLRYRAFITQAFLTPFLINFYAGSKVAAHFAPTIDFTTQPEYTTLLRWGYGSQST